MGGVPEEVEQEKQVAELVSDPEEDKLRQTIEKILQETQIKEQPYQPPEPQNPFYPINHSYYHQPPTLPVPLTDIFSQVQLKMAQLDQEHKKMVNDYDLEIQRLKSKKQEIEVVPDQSQNLEIREHLTALTQAIVKIDKRISESEWTILGKERGRG